MKDLIDFFTGLLAATFIVGLIVMGLAWFATGDKDEWVPLGDGCVLHKSVDRTWFFDSETTRTRYCKAEVL